MDSATRKAIEYWNEGFGLDDYGVSFEPAGPGWAPADLILDQEVDALPIELILNHCEAGDTVAASYQTVPMDWPQVATDDLGDRWVLVISGSTGLQEDRECPRCSEGKVERENNPEGTQWDWEPCHHCKGTGWIPVPNNAQIALYRREENIKVGDTSAVAEVDSVGYVWCRACHADRLVKRRSVLIFANGSECDLGPCEGCGTTINTDRAR